MFKKKEKANDIVNIVSARIDKVVDNVMRKLNFGFDTLSERDEYKTAFEIERKKKDSLEIKNKALTNEIKDLKDEINVLKTNNNKLHSYLEKNSDILKSFNDALIKKYKTPTMHDEKIEKRPKRVNKKEDVANDKKAE